MPGPAAVDADEPLQARSLLSHYEIGGIHLDYIRYPGLEYDYGTSAVSRFESWSGVAPVTVQALLVDHYDR